METTLERVFARIRKVKKRPQRAVVKRVIKPKRVAPISSKYEMMLQKLGKHFGYDTIPDLLDFIADEKRKTTLTLNPKKGATGKYRLVKQTK